MARPIRLGAFLSVVLAFVFAGFFATLLLPHDGYMRYQSFQGTIFARLGWVYDRIVHDDTPVDVVIVGSSRSARGANAALIQEVLTERGHGAVHVANISEPAAGMDIRLSKLRLLFDHQDDVRLVIFPLVEALPRDGHQAFGQLATAGEILSAPWLINRNLPVTLAALPYRQMELALASRVPGAFGYRPAFDPAAYPGPAPDHRLFNDPEWTAVAESKILDTARHVAALSAESAMRKTQISRPLLPGALAWAEFGVSRDTVHQVKALAEENGAELVFLFLPFYDGYDRPLDADWLEGIAPIWIPDFLKDTPSNYIDAAHASQRGVERLAPWLAGKIAKELETAR